MVALSDSVELKFRVTSTFVAQGKKRHKKVSERHKKVSGTVYLTMARRFGNLASWEDQNDQLQAVGFIMC
jgi:hypothetical protein